MQEGEGPELLSCAPAAPEDALKAPWEGLYDTFMPLLISMTFNSPLQFWELNYMQQQNQFDAAAEEQDKVVRTPVRTHPSLQCLAHAWRTACRFFLTYSSSRVGGRRVE